MKLLQKISKKYLSLSFIMFMMVMGVASCDGCDSVNPPAETPEQPGNPVGNSPSISLDKSDLIGDDQSTTLKIAGSGYKAGEFKLRLSATNGTVKIGKQKFDDGKEMLLSAVLEAIKGDEEVKGEESLPVIVDPIDVTKPFYATLIVTDKDGHEVGKHAPLTWAPVNFTGLVLKVGTLKDNKCSVELEALKNAKKVALTAEDLKGISVEITPNLAQFPTVASIVGGLKFEASDINDKGVINKEVTIKKGNEATTLIIILRQLNSSVIVKGNIEVEKMPDYTLALDPKIIDNGATKIKLIVTRGGEEFNEHDLSQLRIHVEKVQLGGIKPNMAKLVGVDIFPSDLLLVGFTIGTDKKSATKDFTIIPEGDQKVKFSFQLESSTNTQKYGKEQILDWHSGNSNIKFKNLTRDPKTGIVQFRLHNASSHVIAKDKLVIEAQNTSKLPVNVNGEELKPLAQAVVSSAVAQQDINSKGDSEVFTMTIEPKANTEKVGLRLFVFYNNEQQCVEIVEYLVPDIQLEFVDIEPVTVVGLKNLVFFEVRNKGNQGINPEDSKMELQVMIDGKENKTFTLSKLLEVNSNRDLIAKGVKSFTYALRVGPEPTYSSKNVEYNFLLMYNGVVQGDSKKITWMKPIFKAGDVEFITDENSSKISLQINKEDAIAPQSLKLEVSSNHPKINFKDNSGLFSGFGKSSTVMGNGRFLSDLPALQGKKELLKGDKISFLNLALDTLDKKYEGGVVDVILTIKSQDVVLATRKLTLVVSEGSLFSGPSFKIISSDSPKKLSNV